MQDVWIDRWREGRIGWHEVDGSGLLKRFWPRLVRGSSVLVPLCGKSVDLVWLAAQGLDVVGVEISDIAVRAFFDEHDLSFENTLDGKLQCYRATTAPIRLYCGDYFDFNGGPFRALYDRGALVAMAEPKRERYVRHTDSMLEPDAYRMIITLEYDQEVVAGPPYSVGADKLRSYWADMEPVHSHNDIETSPPKFRKAGLDEVIESVWTSG